MHNIDDTRRLKSDLRLSLTIQNNNLEHVYVPVSRRIYDNPCKWQITKPNSRAWYAFNN